MEKVDELIETLAEHIMKDLTDDRRVNCLGTVSERTRALAELITARYRMEGTYLQERSTTSGS